MTHRWGDPLRLAGALAMLPFAACGAASDNSLPAGSAQPAGDVTERAPASAGVGATPVRVEANPFVAGDSRFVPDEAVSTAITPEMAVVAAAGFLAPGTAEVTAQLGRYSNDSFGVEGAPPRFHDSPVWAVTYHDVLQEIEGPAGASLPPPEFADTHVIVDAATG